MRKAHADFQCATTAIMRYCPVCTRGMRGPQQVAEEEAPWPNLAFADFMHFKGMELWLR